jgi:hypothetical protein
MLTACLETGNCPKSRLPNGFLSGVRGRDLFDFVMEKPRLFTTSEHIQKVGNGFKLIGSMGASINQKWVRIEPIDI